RVRSPRARRNPAHHRRLRRIMSRIQEILKKAEREGGVHRTRALVAEGPAMGSPSAAAAATMPMPVMPPLHPSEAREVAGHLDHRLVAAFSPQSLAAEQ